MGDTLYFDLSQDRLHPAFNTLDLDLASRALGEEDGEFELSIANSVWGQEGRRVRLAMPKFKLETGTDLADVLARMGDAQHVRRTPGRVPGDQRFLVPERGRRMPQPTSVPTPAPGTTLDAAMAEEPITSVASDREGVPGWLITLINVGFLLAIVGAAVHAYRNLR